MKTLIYYSPLFENIILVELPGYIADWIVTYSIDNEHWVLVGEL